MIVQIQTLKVKIGATFASSVRSQLIEQSHVRHRRNAFHALERVLSSTTTFLAERVAEHSKNALEEVKRLAK